MLLKSLAYIVLWLSFKLLVDCQMILEQRQWHTATFFDNKLYILGGVTADASITNITNEFFYLDTSSPFNTTNLPWKNLSDNTIPVHFGAAAVITKNNTLFLYGGFTSNTTMALVYTFDPNSAKWSIPKID